MRILHGDGFRLREREEARETVISNLVTRLINIQQMIMMMMMMMQVICVYLVLCQMELKKHCSDADSTRSILYTLDTWTENGINNLNIKYFWSINLYIKSRLRPQGLTLQLFPDCVTSGLGCSLC